MGEKKKSLPLLYISQYRKWICSTHCVDYEFDKSSFHLPGEGNGNPLQYSRLENPIDRGT